MPKVYITPHKKIASFFVILTIVALILTIACLIKKTYKTTIIVSAKLEDVEATFDKKISAKIIEKIDTLEKNFSPQSLVKMEDFANGKITIVNNSGQSIILVANTRFQAENGLIYRLTKRTFIPAKSKVRANIRADKIGGEYDINEPTKFVIVNLSPILQEKIYGESKEAIIGGFKETGIVSQKDIDRAKAEIKDELYKKMIEEIKNEFGERNKLAIHSKLINHQCDSKPGEEKSFFNVKITLKVAAARIDENELLKLAQEALSKKIPEGKKLYSVDKTSFRYRLKDYDLDKNIALVETQIKGKSIISENNEIFKRENFVNLSANEIRDILSENDLIEGVKVKFSPFYVKKSPKLPKRIKFIIRTL